MATASITAYRAAFSAGTGLLALAVAVGLYSSYREHRRLPPLAVYSAVAGSVEDMIGGEDGAAAVDELRLMLRLMPTNAELTHNMLGRALEARGELDEALAHFRAAVALDPRFAEAHNNLGVALAKEGRLDEALAEVREALRLEPNLAEARQNLPRMEARLAERSAGAAGGPATPAEVAQGRRSTQQFYRGELEELRARFAAAFAEQMTAEAFAEMRRTASVQLGPETQLLDERVGTLGESTIYVRRARFAHHDGDVEVVVQWAADGSILGFMLRPAAGS